MPDCQLGQDGVLGAVPFGELVGEADRAGDQQLQHDAGGQRLVVAGDGGKAYQRGQDLVGPLEATPVVHGGA
jgi:hypothetical protein